MNDTNVIPPNAVVITDSFKKMFSEQNDAYVRLKNEDEEAWTSFGNHGFYRVLKRYILGLVEQLEKSEDAAFANGASLEEIGLRRAVIRLSKSNLLSIVNKVEQTTIAVNDRRKKEREQARGKTK